MNYLKQILIAEDHRSIMDALNKVMEAFERNSVSMSTVVKAFSYSAAKMHDVSNDGNVFFFDKDVIGWLTKPYSIVKPGKVQDANMFCAPSLNGKHNMMVCHYGFQWINAIQVPLSIPCGAYCYMPNAFALIAKEDNFDPFDMFEIGIKAESAFPLQTKLSSNTPRIGLQISKRHKLLFSTEPVDGEPQYNSRIIQQCLSIQESKMVKTRHPYKMDIYTNVHRNVLFMKYERGYSIVSPEVIEPVATE